jgi:replicative DNA helicase
MAETRGLNVIQGQRPQIEVPSIMQEMTDIIEDVNQYTWDSGNGMNWGMQSLNEAFEGLNSGLHVVGGQPNVGKSSLCMQMAWSIAKSNQQPTATCKNIAYVLYISLDDTVRYILPRVVACEKKIPINVVKMPQKYRNSPEGLTLLTKREDGLRILKQNIKHFKIVDQANVPGIEDIETISSEIDRHNTKLKEINEDYKLGSYR